MAHSVAEDHGSEREQLVYDGKPELTALFALPGREHALFPTLYEPCAEVLDVLGRDRAHAPADEVGQDVAIDAVLVFGGREVPYLVAHVCDVTR